MISVIISTVNKPSEVMNYDCRRVLFYETLKTNIITDILSNCLSCKI